MREVPLKVRCSKMNSEREHARLCGAMESSIRENFFLTNTTGHGSIKARSRSLLHVQASTPRRHATARFRDSFSPQPFRGQPSILWPLGVVVSVWADLVGVASWRMYTYTTTNAHAQRGIVHYSVSLVIARAVFRRVSNTVIGIIGSIKSAI